MRTTAAALPDAELAYVAAALTQGDDAVVVTDPAGRITWVNAGFERLCGYASAAVLGHRPGELLQGPGTDADEVRRIRDALARAEPVQAELVNYRADGRPYWVSIAITPVHDGHGGVARFVAVERDVTAARGGAEPAGIADDVPELIVRFGPDVRFRYVNRAAERVVGRPRAAILGRTPAELELPRGLAEPLAGAVRQALATGEPQVLVLEDDRGGAVRSYDTRLAPARDLAGRVASVLAVGRDTTAERAAAQSLRESEERLRVLLGQLPAVVWVADRSLRLTSVHGSARHLGRAERSVPGTPLDELLRERLSEPGPVLTAHRRALGGERVTYEVSVGGHHLHAHVEPLRDAGGAVSGVVGVALDVSERVALEVGLRQSGQHFRALIEQSAEVITVLEADGAIRYESPAVERVLGWRAAELVGRNAFDFVHPDDRDRVRELFARTVREPGFVTPVEMRFLHKDGAWRVLEATGTNALDNAAVGGLVVNSRDVTERRRLEAELQQAQKLEAVGLLAGGVAHDFNNLLTVIRGGVELVLEEHGASAAARADLADVRAACDRAAALTGQLLAFARRQVLQPRVVELNAVVRGIEALLGRLIVERVTLALRLDPAAGRVRVDPGQLEQTVMNLALNARDAMPDGGAVTVATARLRLAADDPAHPGVPPGDYALLTVRDTGPGIDPAVLPHIFDPFFTTKERGRGTGLGLATVHGIVQQSGGRVRVASERGRGTTFLVYLPRVAEAEAAADGGAAPAPPAPAASAVLVVDDEPGVLRVAERALVRHGYAVRTVADGGEALRLLERPDVRVDVLLTDLLMPVLGGRELVERATRLRPGLACVVMSGYSHDERGEDAARAVHGAAFVQKPFSAEDLVRAVGAALERAAL